MSTFKRTLVLGLLLLANACSVGTVTASSRMAGMGGGVMGPGPQVQANSPGYVEHDTAGPARAERSETGGRELRSFSIESDCWRCR